MADDDLVVRAELLDGVSGPARRAEASVDRLAAGARRAGAATGGQGTSGVLQMATAGDRLTKMASQADSSLVRMSNTVTGKLVSGLKVAALGLGALGVAAVGYGVKTAASFEQQRIQLEGLTGSASEAAKVFGFISDLDPNSPFDIKQLSTATTMLASAGLEPAFDAAKAVITAHFEAHRGDDSSVRVLLQAEVQRLFGHADCDECAGIIPDADWDKARLVVHLLAGFAEVSWRIHHITTGVVREVVRQHNLDPLVEMELLRNIDFVLDPAELLPIVFQPGIPVVEDGP